MPALEYIARDAHTARFLTFRVERLSSTFENRYRYQSYPSPSLSYGATALHLHGRWMFEYLTLRAIPLQSPPTVVPSATRLLRLAFTQHRLFKSCMSAVRSLWH